MTVQMVIDRGPRQAQNSTSEALKHWCSLTPIEKISSQWTHHSGLDIENLANLSKTLPNLVDLTLEKQKICKTQQFFS